jgi:hypothetical protein
MIDLILRNKILGVIAILIALVMIAHSMIAPTVGTLAVTILAISYAGLVGVPALIKRKE